MAVTRFRRRPSLTTGRSKPRSANTGVNTSMPSGSVTSNSVPRVGCSRCEQAVRHKMQQIRRQESALAALDPEATLWALEVVSDFLDRCLVIPMMLTRDRGREKADA